MYNDSEYSGLKVVEDLQFLPISYQPNINHKIVNSKGDILPVYFQ